MTAYKVLLRTDTGLVSFGGKNMPEGYMVEYKEGEVIKANNPNSPLFVFESMELIKHFLFSSFYEDLEIWEVVIEPYPIDVKTRLSTAPPRNTRNILNYMYNVFWKKNSGVSLTDEEEENYLLWIKKIREYGLPEGTLLASSLTLVQRLEVGTMKRDEE